MSCLHSISGNGCDEDRDGSSCLLRLDAHIHPHGEVVADGHVGHPSGIGAPDPGIVHQKIDGRKDVIDPGLPAGRVVGIEVWIVRLPGRRRFGDDGPVHPLVVDQVPDGIPKNRRVVRIRVQVAHDDERRVLVEPPGPPRVVLDVKRLVQVVDPKLHLVVVAVVVATGHAVEAWGRRVAGEDVEHGAVGQLHGHVPVAFGREAHLCPLVGAVPWRERRGIDGDDRSQFEVDYLHAFQGLAEN